MELFFCGAKSCAKHFIHIIFFCPLRKMGGRSCLYDCCPLFLAEEILREVR
jgi:hypothetical protein